MAKTIRNGDLNRLLTLYQAVKSVDPETEEPLIEYVESGQAWAMLATGSLSDGVDDDQVSSEINEQYLVKESAATNAIVKQCKYSFRGQESLVVGKRYAEQPGYLIIEGRRIE